MSIYSNGQPSAPPPTQHKKPFSVKCRNCDQEIWLHVSKHGKRYPTNSETSRKDFHNCEKGPIKAEKSQHGAQFGGNSARQLDLELDLSENAEGVKICALVTFPEGTSAQDAKAILTRLGDDAKVVRMQVME